MVEEADSKFIQNQLTLRNDYYQIQDMNVSDGTKLCESIHLRESFFFFFITIILPLTHTSQHVFRIEYFF